MILDRDLTAKSLSQTIASLRDEPGRLSAMAEAARALGRPEATERVVEVCLDLIRNRARGH